MNKLVYLLLFITTNLCFANINSVLGQDTDSDTDDPYKGPEPLDIVFKPKLSLGIGMFTFYGDVSSNHGQYHPTVSRLAYELKLINPLTDYLDLNFYALFGQVSANERTLTRNLNFNSNITTGGLTFTYNFRNFSDFKKTNVNPFISLGFESVEFLSKSDLKDKNGNTYYYWSDGNIMDRAEDDPTAGSAVELYRDYTYESDLRELNLDGNEKYPERTWAIPVEVGANFVLGKKIDFRVATSMHFTTTDLIDNVTSESTGLRAGNKGNDKFLYTSVSLVYNLSFNKGDKIRDDEDGDQEYWNEQYAQDTSDYDGDGVGDLADLCAKTPIDWRPVDEHGCPLDNDKDGISDNVDDELDTPENAPVDTNGVAYTDDDFFLMYRMYKDSTGEFTTYEEVKNSTESEGGGLTPSTDGIVQGSKESYTVIIGSDSTGITANDLHKHLSFKDFKIVDNGDQVYYIVGDFDNIEDAIARQGELADQGIGGTIGKTRTDERGNKDIEDVAVDNLTATASGDFSTNHGTIYKVQIGAFSKKLSGNVFRETPDLAYLKGDDGLWRYYSGTFSDKNSAAKHRIDMLEDGYHGSFIVAFKDGDRLTLNEAGYEVNPDYNDTKEESDVPTENAINSELIKFKVQVGAFESKIPTDILDLYLSIGNVIPKKDPSTGLTKYFIGTTNSYKEAKALKEELRDKGLVDSFVVGEFNGKIITAQEAIDLLK